MAKTTNGRYSKKFCNEAVKMVVEGGKLGDIGGSRQPLTEIEQELDRVKRELAQVKQELRGGSTRLNKIF